MAAEIELKAGDARAALGIAAAVAECADAAELAAGLGELGRLVGAEGVLVVGGRGWMSEVAVEVGDPGVFSPALLEAIGHCWRDHPVLVPDLAVAARGARRLSDHVGSREWRRRGLFNDFYRPLGMAYELSAQLAWGPVGSSCCVTLHRAGRDFGPREVALLELLAPHLRAARVRVAAGSRSPGQADLLVEGRSAAHLARRLPITPREAEVLAHLAAGLTNRGIAEELGISRHTVVRHVEHLYAKLDVHTRAAATGAALAALFSDA